jgi:hypothetical protein
MIRTVWKWDRAELQTAVTLLRNRSSGRGVTLVSMIHVGRADYYDAIASLIATIPAGNGVVLYEGLGSLTEAEIRGLSEQESAVYRALAPLHGLYRVLARSLGLVFQGEALQYDRARWINADLSLRDLVRRWVESGAPLLPLGAGANGEVAAESGRLAGSAGALMLLTTPLLLWLLGRVGRMIPMVRTLRELLVNDRNRAALDAFERTDPARNAVILYGAAHIAGLSEWLQRRGFVVERRHWLTAFSYALPWSRLLRRGARAGRAGQPVARPASLDRERR